MRRFILTITAAAMMAAMTVVTASPVLGQDLVAGTGNLVALSQPKGETEAGFIDLVPVQQCLFDAQGGMVFRVINQGLLWTAPATTTTVAVSTGGAPFHVDFPTAPIPPGGFVDLSLGDGPASLGVHVVGFAVTADSTNQVVELNKRNNTVGGSCSDRVGGGPTLPNTGGLSPEWLYAMFAAGGVLVSASLTAGIFGLRRRI
ncbi:MAG: hypothetical protein LC751_20650 [Actinobacteria bacterium]|nr:hypothetical protein [Actinomycetota bacterium]